MSDLVDIGPGVMSTNHEWTLLDAVSNGTTHTVLLKGVNDTTLEEYRVSIDSYSCPPRVLEDGTTEEVPQSRLVIAGWLNSRTIHMYATRKHLANIMKVLPYHGTLWSGVTQRQHSESDDE